MTVAKRDGRTGMAASLGGDTPAITARSLRHSTPPQMAKVELRARFESYGAGSRLRLGWARRWSMRRIAARVTMASDTSGGYDAVKRVKGRKRHIAVDTDGRLLMVNLVPANVQDAKGAEAIIKAIRRRWPWLK